MHFEVMSLPMWTFLSGARVRRMQLGTVCVCGEEVGDGWSVMRRDEAPTSRIARGYVVLVEGCGVAEGMV